MMKYQLVLQLPAASIEDYDALIELEESIMEGLGAFGDVDGHDAGSGEMNIFIHTDEPKPAFERIEALLGTRDFMPDLKAAYREIGKSEFVIIHPPGLTRFAVA
jgi:hypothetical protein